MGDGIEGNIVGSGGRDDEIAVRAVTAVANIPLLIQADFQLIAGGKGEIDFGDQNIFVVAGDKKIVSMISHTGVAPVGKLAADTPVAFRGGSGFRRRGLRRSDGGLCGHSGRFGRFRFGRSSGRFRGSSGRFRGSSGRFGLSRLGVSRFGGIGGGHTGDQLDLVGDFVKGNAVFSFCFHHEIAVEAIAAVANVPIVIQADLKSTGTVVSVAGSQMEIIFGDQHIFCVTFHQRIVGMVALSGFSPVGELAADAPDLGCNRHKTHFLGLRIEADVVDTCGLDPVIGAGIPIIILVVDLKFLSLLQFKIALGQQQSVLLFHLKRRVPVRTGQITGGHIDGRFGGFRFGRLRLAGRSGRFGCGRLGVGRFRRIGGGGGGIDRGLGGFNIGHQADLVGGQVEGDVVVAGGGYLDITTVKGIVCTVADVPTAIETNLKFVPGFQRKGLLGGKDVFRVTFHQRVVGMRTLCVVAPVGHAAADAPLLIFQGFQADFCGFGVKGDVENTGGSHLIIIFRILIFAVEADLKGIIGTQQEIVAGDKDIFLFAFDHKEIFSPGRVVHGADGRPDIVGRCFAFAGPNQFDLMGNGVEADAVLAVIGNQIVVAGVGFRPIFIFADLKVHTGGHFKSIPGDQDIFFVAGDHFKILIPVCTIDCSDDGPCVSGSVNAGDQPCT